MAKAILGQRQARSGNRAHVGIADQRQNRVIERGGRNLDSSVLRGFGVRGQDFGQQFALMGHHEALVVQRVAAAFLNEPGDVGIVQEVFVEPGDLREHLQVGKVLRREIFFRAFRCAAGVAKVVPQFLVARIASNQIYRIGLEEILQCEMTLVGSEISCRLGGNFEEGVARRSGHVVLNLRDQ